MKRLITAIVLFVFSAAISAQDITLTKPGNHFYADMISKAATLNGSWGLFGGMRAGYIINENVSIGLAAHGMIPVHLGGSYINNDQRDDIHLGYGGAEASYKYDLSDKFYLNGTMMIGAGRVDYEIGEGDDYFFIAEPGASLNFKLTEWFGIGYAVNYRFASGVKYADFSNASFSGWSTDLSLKFGFSVH